MQLLRLLMAEPTVLLLDEPTNDLDTDTLTALDAELRAAGADREAAETAWLQQAESASSWPRVGSRRRG